MLLLVLLFILYPVRLHSFEVCDFYESSHCKQLNFNNKDDCRVKVSNSTESCQNVGYTGGDNLKHDFGDLYLELETDLLYTYLDLRIYPSVQWEEAVIKISDYKDAKSCETFTVTDSAKILKYDCRLNDETGPIGPFLLEIFSENDGQLAQKKIVFTIPNPVAFRHTTSTSYGHIFSYIDFTNSGKFVLKIQPLPEIYKVTHYKVEVFREKNNNAVMLDVRLISAAEKGPLEFEYITYSEEGYYYFVISQISLYCPEDFCPKTVTPKVHVARKGRPLVIGIVGASFLIPFVLFSFYWWNYKYRNQGCFVSEPIQKVLVLFKPSFEKHNDVVSALIDSIETFSEPAVIVDKINLTKVKEKTVEKFCSDNLILATHIIYVNPPAADDESSCLDYMTFSFLKEETKKVTTDRKLIVIKLPYSKMETPSILSKASHYELIKDYDAFIKLFYSQNYSNNPVYTGLVKKIEVATDEAENLRIVPEIVVTDEVEEANEVDGLIG